MEYKRILTIQDISCVGQCSMTVALPILSACGHETCILPTVLLSAHTGGFGKPEVIHFDASLDAMWKHWDKNGITFDAILVGYLGSIEAVSTAGQIIDALLAPDGISIVDPAFADHGKRYSGLSEEYARAMKKLCGKADIILPNITEASIFADIPYKETLDEGYITNLLEALGHRCIVLTGVGFQEGQTGIMLREDGEQYHYTHKSRGGSYHGTGDMFAASFTGALMQNRSKQESIKIAADFVCKAIEKTMENPAHWYGVKFESALPDLIRTLQA